MAFFNVSKLNPNIKPKGGGGSSTGLFNDQLRRMEYEMSQAGFGQTPPGGYDVLIEEIRGFLNANPGLSESQRSDYETKIKKYETEQFLQESKRAGDTTYLDNTINGARANIAKQFGTNPLAYLSNEVSLLLQESNYYTDLIAERAGAGVDVSAYEIKRREIASELREKELMLEDVQNWTVERLLDSGVSPDTPEDELLQLANQLNTDPSAGPVSNVAAYVKTNSRGEIVSVEYGRPGTKSDYYETSAMMNGVPVFGVPNEKRDGVVRFNFGNNIFQTVDSSGFDPATGLIAKTPRLVAVGQQTLPGQDGAQSVTGAEYGYMNFNPTSLTQQSYLDKNEWAKSTDGSLYYRGEDGSYTKHINPSEIIDRPKRDQMYTFSPDEEMSIAPMITNPVVDESQDIDPNSFVDFAGPVGPQLPEGGVGALPQDPALTSRTGGRIDRTAANNQAAFDQALGTREAPQEQASAGQSTQVRRSAKAPTERAPKTALGIASNAVRSGVDFLKSTFS